MKKIVVFILIAIFGIACLSSCEQFFHTHTYEIKECPEGHFKSYTCGCELEVEVEEYYGEFESGAIVAMMGGGMYTDSLWDEMIDGITINYYNDNRILVLYEGGFYTLTEAYEEGVIYICSDTVFKFVPASSFVPFCLELRGISFGELINVPVE